MSIRNDELFHHGIKGMKWGVRRYQNADGTLTNAGKKRVYKTVKKYSKQKRSALGQAVGEDKTITEAARKVLPLAKKHAEASARRGAMAAEMEKEYNDGKTYNEIANKYQKKYDTLLKQEARAATNYDEGTKKVVDEYLGKYADKRIKDLDKTAGEALATQIKWGVGLGRTEGEKKRSIHLINYKKSERMKNGRQDKK